MGRRAPASHDGLLAWAPPLGLRALCHAAPQVRASTLVCGPKAMRVWAPKYGHLRLVATRNRHGNYEALATNGLDDDLTTVVLRKRARWSVETVFRDTKQYASLEGCQSWTDVSWVRHVAFVLLAFVVLQRMLLSTAESVAAVHGALPTPCPFVTANLPLQRSDPARLISGPPRNSCHIMKGPVTQPGQAEHTVAHAAPKRMLHHDEKRAAHDRR